MEVEVDIATSNKEKITKNFGGNCEGQGHWIKKLSYLADFDRIPSSFVKKSNESSSAYDDNSPFSSVSCSGCDISVSI